MFASQHLIDGFSGIPKEAVLTLDEHSREIAVLLKSQETHFFNFFFFLHKTDLLRAGIYNLKL